MLNENGIYDTFKVDEMLKKFKNNNLNKFMEEVFKNQKGNQLYIISFFAQKKIEEPGFLEELEKNYGVYLDVDNFIKDMKKKLEEIKNYKDLYAFIGTDFGKDKTDLELFIEAYGKAKEKGYIKPFNNSLHNSYNHPNTSNERFIRPFTINPPRFFIIPPFHNINPPNPPRLVINVRRQRSRSSSSFNSNNYDDHIRRRRRRRRRK
jgi:hypothetical protein